VAPILDGPGGSPTHNPKKGGAEGVITVAHKMKHGVDLLSGDLRYNRWCTIEME
jgi:hypothetical protein